ncbi:hypothetical protein [Crocinitomix algicola]|uniref:hypothetical protein n=1 Tax=Crocinitomix algicola TaxID=1740263 RepID=UPI0008722121|nr:hypothetical protein [Crocinitomix algicola]
MKKIILGFILLSTVSIGFGQTEPSKETKTNRIKVVKGGEPVVEKGAEQKSPADELKACEAQLKAINAKEAHLKADPKRNKEALDNGWYREAERNKLILSTRIKELKKEINK